MSSLESIEIKSIFPDAEIKLWDKINEYQELINNCKDAIEILEKMLKKENATDIDREILEILEINVTANNDDLINNINKVRIDLMQLQYEKFILENLLKNRKVILDEVLKVMDIEGSDSTEALKNAFDVINKLI